jgi:acetamidase/formamidase
MAHGGASAHRAGVCEGAEPGDLLEIEYLDIRLERYGRARFAPGGGFLPEDIVNSA